MTFELEVTDSSRLIDAEPRLMPCVVAKPVSELKLQMDEGKQESEENMLMRAIAANRNSSIASLAIACGFGGANGQPQKSKVYRMCSRLSAPHYPLAATAIRRQSRWLDAYAV